MKFGGLEVKFTRNAGKVAKRSGLGSPIGWLIDAIAGLQNVAGVNVNTNTALTLSAVYRAVNILSNTLASIPLNVYKRGDHDTR